MALMVGAGVAFAPLTREVFGPAGDRVIIGSLEPYSHIASEESLGICLHTEEECFTHPTLFNQRGMWKVQVRLVQDKVLMEALCIQDPIPSQQGALAETTPVSLDVIIAMALILQNQRGACKSIGCITRLNLRQGIFLQADPDRVLKTMGVHCIPCFEKLREKESRVNPNFMERVMLDGRKIPFQAPVPIFK